jgi:hypothetical protein
MKFMHQFGTPALESIAFQNGAFFKEMTACFESARESIKAGDKNFENSDEFMSILSAVARHHTGLSINVQFAAYGPAIQPPIVDRNNVLLNDMRQAYFTSGDGLRIIAEAGKAVRGTVSLKNARVSGIFEKLTSILYWPIDMIIDTKFTSEELAAIAMHEFGHVFTYFEFLANTVKTNQVLEGLNKALATANTPEDRTIVLHKAAQALDADGEWVSTAAQSTNKDVLQNVFVSNVMRKNRSQSTVGAYDEASWEYLCDEFAARMGAGRPLATALDKLMRSSWNISTRSTASYLAFEAFKMSLLVAIVLAPVGVFAFLQLMILACAWDSSSDDYDRPGARLNRIRQQFVELAKTPKLPPAKIKALLADLEVMDALEKSYTDNRQLVGIMLDSIIPSFRRARADTLLQQELEDLALNNLFVKSLEFKMLA